MLLKLVSLGTPNLPKSPPHMAKTQCPSLYFGNFNITLTWYA